LNHSPATSAQPTATTATHHLIINHPFHLLSRGNRVHLAVKLFHHAAVTALVSRVRAQSMFS
jgi:hypothetical protein